MYTSNPSIPSYTCIHTNNFKLFDDQFHDKYTLYMYVCISLDADNQI